ncbi:MULTISPECIES: helix-turn-helix transcriptional regulator [Streptomyces]|uniref:Helix-turn-helix domain-containing protein n=1 Tax=Streptomyces anthocyanicus TaxID=68174 RepID=A0ABZ1M5Q1_9ACTN|nr:MULTISPECIES: helix-turn-helix domain-containing protein [Streptomyces]MDX2930544.1 helix-turn-helix domain-containing protein [Streptomyces sp. NRRL_B-16638]MDX3408847.1 helix-turn-helix domain-containing protein [Streptomyces sp. ME02-6977A]WMT37162.1 helix-turn-helix domain-containing protein [Streptomyces coelicolor]
MPNEPITPVANTEPRHEKEASTYPAASPHPAVSPDNQAPLLTNPWYSTSDLAARLKVDASTLRRWRTAQPPQGPPFVTVSERVVMYSALDVDEWLRRRRTVPTKGLNGR